MKTRFISVIDFVVDGRYSTCGTDVFIEIKHGKYLTERSEHLLKSLSSYVLTVRSLEVMFVIVNVCPFYVLLCFLVLILSELRVRLKNLYLHLMTLF